MRNWWQWWNSNSADFLVPILGFAIVSLTLYLIAEELKNARDESLRRIGLNAFSHFGGIDPFQKQALCVLLIAVAVIVAILATLLVHNKLLAGITISLAAVYLVPTLLQKR